MIKLNKSGKVDGGLGKVFIVRNFEGLKEFESVFTAREKEFLTEKDGKDAVLSFSSVNEIKEVIYTGEDCDFETYEKVRRYAVKVYKNIAAHKHTAFQLINLTGDKEFTKAFVEGFWLYDYRFLKYFTKEKEDKESKFESISVVDNELSDSELTKVYNVIQAVYKTRDLVNEPSMYLTATELANQIKLMGEDAGFSVEIFEKSKIEALKMGGLLAVNRGSQEPPTFTILEWKPEGHKNDKPLVFVGKGVVFDTGGLNLKPGNYMEGMQADMAGAAAVAGSIYGIAKNKLPVWVIGLVPATDNRPGEKAYAPQDVITMHNGMTVEVLNTDAEGRMILADALSYASKYDPQLVIDLATLTGAAARAIGRYGIVAMHNEESACDFDKLAEAGEKTSERVVEFPFWDDYNELLKSNVADIKNIGGVEAGAITAGKFLEHFTSYPYIHLDIAGPAYIDKNFHYMKTGGTGIGVRLLNEFAENF